MSSRAGLISRAFGKARDYDRHATAQAASARRLAELALARGVAPGARVLDMGCGTGALAAHLLASGLPGRYVCADISPDMLARAARRLEGATPRPLLAAMDALEPALKPGFTLIASSMALHWAQDMKAALASLWGLLAPGGLLAVAIPGEGTFAPWRAAHEALGFSCGLREFPSATSLTAMFPGGAEIFEEHFSLGLSRALELPRHLKAVGGFVPRPGHAPLTPGRFRAVLSRLDADWANVGPGLGYHVLFALASRPALG